MKLGAWGAEVIPARGAELEEFSGDFRTEAMDALIAPAGAAEAIAEESGHGVDGAGGEWSTEDVVNFHEMLFSGGDSGFVNLFRFSFSNFDGVRIG